MRETQRLVLHDPPRSVEPLLLQWPAHSKRVWEEAPWSSADHHDVSSQAWDVPARHATAPVLDIQGQCPNARRDRVGSPGQYRPVCDADQCKKWWADQEGFG